MASRAERFLASLSAAELRQLDDAIDAVKRPATKALYAALKQLRKKEEPADKEHLFQQLFGRQWSRKEDYLLRNELRLLSEKIQEMLVQWEQERELRRRPSLRDQFLLRALLHRRLLPEFEEELPRAYSEAIQRLDYANARLINDLRHEHLMLFCEITPERMEQAHQTMVENLSNLKRIYRSEVAINQHNRVACEQTLRAMGKPMPTTTVGSDDDFGDTSTPFIEFYEQASRAHQSLGEARVEHARNAATQIGMVATIFPDHTVWGFAILASSLLVEQRYSEANGVFQSALEFIQANRLSPPPDMLFNYASTLMKLQEFERVLALIQEYSAIIKERPKVYFRFEVLRCFCHIFLRQPDQAFAAIPPAITQRPESEYQYFRFLYLIIPYLRGDLDSAIRETRNFNDYFTRHKDALLYPKEKEVVALFRAFFVAIADSTDKRMLHGALTNIQHQMQGAAERSPEYSGYLYLRWLQEEIERVMKVGLH